MACLKVLFVSFLFVWCLETAAGGRLLPSSVPSTSLMRPLITESGDYVTMKPQVNHKEKVFKGREVKGCMPKGLRHSSAPSRFVNYQPLGSANCFSNNKGHSKNVP